MTINPTTTPITRMMSGSSSDMKPAMRVSTIRSKESDTLSSIFSSSPLFSPTETICTTTGGNRPLLRRGSAMGSPSRTLSRARCTAFASTVLPITLLVKYFTQVGDKWKISEDLRKMVTYRVFNLLDGMSALGKFDVVFCRNVLIYFDQVTKSKVLASIADIMAPDGVLYLGGAETVLGISDRLQMVEGQRGIYGLANATTKSNMVA